MRVNAKSTVVGIEFDVTLTLPKMAVSVVKLKSSMFVRFFQKFGVMVGQGFDFPHKTIIR